MGCSNVYLYKSVGNMKRPVARKVFSRKAETRTLLVEVDLVHSLCKLRDTAKLRILRPLYSHMLIVALTLFYMIVGLHRVLLKLRHVRWSCTRCSVHQAFSLFVPSA